MEYYSTIRKDKNTAIGDSMDGSWEYPAKQSKSDRKSQELYDFTPYVGYKTESNKLTNKKNRWKFRHRQQYGGSQRERAGEGRKGYTYMVKKGDLTLGGKHTM